MEGVLLLVCLDDDVVLTRIVAGASEAAVQKYAGGLSRLGEKARRALTAAWATAAARLLGRGRVALVAWKACRLVRREVAGGIWG